MAKYILLVFTCLTSLHAISQSYARVRVYATNAQLKQYEETLGICLDHGKRKQNTWIETDLSTNEIAILRANGASVDVLIQDVKKHYKETTTVARKNKASVACNGATVSSYVKPFHFKTGSMGGFPTYAQIMSDLDSMALLYPSLIKPKTAIGTYLTQNGKTIDWVKISNNPMVDEAEPELLITALHHAREPGSVTQLMYFMWYLLENYGTNPEITYLLDNTEIYIIPVVNPDGYLYNELTDPTGGGLWRKNRKNNGDGTYGVDLNRNYSFKFGVSGTSTTTSSDVYSGPSAFSEPETQAVRDFVLSHQFGLALNYHTYGNYLLYPYGYDYVTPVDKSYFEDMSSLMVCENNYANIQSVNLYPASGDSDDWMYGDTVTKPRMFAFTPEIGSGDFGFWPPASEIQNICVANMFQNLTALKMMHYYGMAQNANASLFRSPSLTQYFKFQWKKLGLKNTGTSTVSITPLSANVASVGSPKSYTNISGYTSLLDSINFTLNAGTPYGVELKFVLVTTNASGTIADTVTTYYGDPSTLFSSDFSSLTAFTNVGFSTTNSQFISPSFSLTDSPTGNYSAFSNKHITTPNITIPASALFAQVRFNAKWDIEQGYDYAQVLISTDNGASFTPLCGRYTKAGTPDQDEGKPLYDGTMADWILEEINLNAYIGQTIQVRIRFISDAGVQADGIYVDDFYVEIINPNGILDQVANAEIKCWPNPVTQICNIYNQYEPTILSITDITGKTVQTNTLYNGLNTIDMHALANGQYVLQFNNKKIKPVRLTILK